MKFSFIDKILQHLHLQPPELELLKPDSNLYTALLYQPNGDFNASSSSFSNRNQNETIDKLNDVINKALEKNAALLVTPEYHCPWKVIQNILDEKDRQPAEGKIWVFGCESIAIKELTDFKEHNKDKCIIYFDEDVLTKTGNFLDPVCYIFKTKDSNDDLKTVCLIQFKTQHMGVWDSPIERKSYIKGEEIYIFRNNADSIYLFTLICSEAMHFQITNDFKAQIDNRWDHNPYLILNIQLNPKPNHADFKRFRADVLKYQNKEIISLNWSNGTIINIDANTSELNNYSRSGFYTSSDQIDFKDEKAFLNNHKFGLYYTHKKTNLHYFHFNSTIELFEVKCTKPYQGPTDPTTRRTGPQVENCYSWDSANNNFITEAEVDDQLIKFLDERGFNGTILKEEDINCIDKERLVCLSCGYINYNGEIPWHRIDKLKSCTLPENESICRVTFAQDTEGHQDRIELIKNFEQLNKIVQDSERLPDILKFFENNFDQVMFYRDGESFIYNYNLVSSDLQNKATGAFLGVATQSEAQQTRQKIVRLFTKEESQSRKRVVVWYQQGTDNINPVYDPTPPRATDDYTDDPESIKRI